MNIKLISSVLSLLLLAGCSTTGNTSSTGNPGTAASGTEKIKAVTSINPVDQLVRYIGGDKVETTLFVPPGVEPHDFEPTAKQMAALRESKVLFINGLDMEHWAEDGSITGSTKLMMLSDGVDIIPLNSQSGEHSAGDPHVWLGLKELKHMAQNTATALTILAPADRAYFEANLARFNAQADALTNEFGPKFEAYKGHGFVTGHEAFAYLCRNIGLVQKAVEGPFAEGEPTPQKIKELVDYVKAEKINTIFVEEMASPAVSDTLARETGAKLVTLPTMETQGEIFPVIREIYEKVLLSLEQSK